MRFTFASGGLFEMMGTPRTHEVAFAGVLDSYGLTLFLGLSHDPRRWTEATESKGVMQQKGVDSTIREARH